MGYEIFGQKITEVRDIKTPPQWGLTEGKEKISFKFRVYCFATIENIKYY